MNDQLDIVFVSTHFAHVRGGAEINDRYLGRALRDFDHDVTYVTLRDDSKKVITEDENVQFVDCTYWYDWSYSLPEPLGKVLRHLNEEVFIWHTKRKMSSVLSDADLILTTGRPILVRIGRITPAPLAHAVRGRVNPLYIQYLRRADGLVFWGGCENDYDESILSSPHVRLDPGVDTELFRPIERSAFTPPEYATGERTVLTFVGRLEPVKRVDRLIDATAKLEEKFDLTLTIIGTGSHHDKLEKYAQNKLERTPVAFTGQIPQEDVPVHLNVSDIFVLSSQMENHPIAIKEALACGTYVVAPAIGRVSSIIPEDAGTVYENNSVAGLKKALFEVLNNNVYNKPMEYNDRDFNSWDDNACEIIELYKKLSD